MTQSTLSEYARDDGVPDRILQYADQFKAARQRPVPAECYRHSRLFAAAKRRGFNPESWIAHGGFMPPEHYDPPTDREYHVDDRAEPGAEDRHFVAVHYHTDL